MEDPIIEQQIVKPEVVYRRAGLFHRMMAELVDFLLLALLFFGLLLLARLIVNNTPYHNFHFNRVEEIRLASNLYKEKDGTQLDVVTWIDKSDMLSFLDKKIAAKQHIEGNGSDITGFLNFCSDTTYGGSVELQNKVTEDYETFLLSDINMFNGKHLFVRGPDNKVIEQTDIGAEQKLFYASYCAFIDKKAQGYLATSFPPYSESMKQLSIMIFAIEMPVSYAIAGILVYFVPTVIFKRGHKTIGKLAYKVGVVGDDCLNISFRKNLIRFIIFYFAIFLLSILTFTIPVIISFTMKVFSKKKQSFTDYMLGLNEIDTSGMKIYNSFEEACIDQIPNYKAPISFKRVEKE